MSKLEYKKQKEKRDIKLSIICGLVLVAITIVVALGLKINQSVSLSQGKISAGEYENYIGENYQAVAEQFEEMGFENVVIIDLKETGLSSGKDGEVKNISINGNDCFVKANYFYPDEKVIIKYY